MALRPDQLESYRRDGYLVVEGFVAAEACDRLIARAAELVAGFAPDADLPDAQLTDAQLPDAQSTVFSTDAEGISSHAENQIPPTKTSFIGNSRQLLRGTSDYGTLELT